MHATVVRAGNRRGIGTPIGREGPEAEQLASGLGGRATAATVGEPRTGDVVMPAARYGALADVLERHGEQLEGRIVVDVVNPVDFEPFEPITPERGSTAQEIAAARPNARVVKAFDTTFATTLVAGEVGGRPLEVFTASDDDDAKRLVAQLAEDGGLRAVDAGALRRVRELEALGYLHMAIQGSLGTGFSSAVLVVA